MAINDELRQEVIKRASNRCEYCRVSANERLLRFEIDHIIAIKHGGNDDSSNLAYACYKCNGFKGSNIAGADPLSQKATFLFNPRKDTWDEHFNI
jgi:5-methylcytosine-specific restriction endonuclease McrA